MIAPDGEGLKSERAAKSRGADVSFAPGYAFGGRRRRFLGRQPREPFEFVSDKQGDGGDAAALLPPKLPVTKAHRLFDFLEVPAADEAKPDHPPGSPPRVVFRGAGGRLEVVDRSEQQIPERLVSTGCGTGHVLRQGVQEEIGWVVHMQEKV